MIFGLAQTFPSLQIPHFHDWLFHVSCVEAQAKPAHNLGTCLKSFPTPDMIKQSLQGPCPGFWGSATCANLAQTDGVEEFASIPVDTLGP